MAFQTVNPFTGEKIKSFDEISEKELGDKVKKSEACFKSWRNISFEDRKKIVQKTKNFTVV